MTVAPRSGPHTIWYISKYFAVPRGNEQGSRGFELLRALAEDGHRCVVFTSDSNHLIEAPQFEGRSWIQVVDGVTIVWLRTLKYEGAKSIRRILSWLHFEFNVLTTRKHTFGRPDVVVASSLSLLSVLSGYLLHLRHRTRFAFEVRDIWPLTLTAEGGFSRRNPLVRVLAMVEKFGYKRADITIGTMPNLGEHVQEVTGRSLAVACVPMGVATRTLDRGKPVERAWVDTNIPTGKFLVGYAGTIGSTNALDGLLQAAAELEHREEIHFVFVGRGDLLSSYVDEYGERPNITFTGAVPKESVNSVLQHFDLLVLTTHASEVWQYGQSLNKLIDYMLAGKPVVAAMTGYPSMLNEAGSGTFVRSGDKEALAQEILRYSAMSADERRQIGQRGRSWLLQHQTYSELSERLLDALLGDRREAG